MRKILAIMIIVTLTLSMYSLAIPASASSTTIPDYQAVDLQSGLAGKVNMPVATAADVSGQEISAFAVAPAVGTKAYDWYLRSISRNTPTGTQPWMTLRAISGNVEVWTQDYMWFLPGDPRNDNPINFNVTDAMCQYLADQFNNVIYPTDTKYFGVPFDRNGTNTIFEQLGFPSYYWDWIQTDNPQRVIIKILNYRDQNYFDYTYPYYVAGFYEPTLTKVYYNRNMIQIDPWQFWRRLGPEGTQWFPDHPELKVAHGHAYEYEATTAHEFQHLIHGDWLAGDDTFMNEGCSMYAEFLCGYGIAVNDINSYLATPDNSLTVWGDQGDINILADYGVAELWTIYLSDHYGGAGFISYYMQAGIPSIAGINNALKHFGYKVTFDQVYHDWRIANLVHSDFPGYGKYNYKSINLNDPEYISIRTYNVTGFVPWSKGSDFGTTKTILGYDTGISMIASYGSDYISFRDWFKPGIISFKGDTSTVYGWTYNATGGYWWSGNDNLYNALLTANVQVDPSNPTLTLVSKWGAESFWDFCFVQVSTDNGKTWTSLANAYTTSDHDPSAHPAIVAYLPGLTDYNPEWPDWTTMTFDLSPYAGQNVMIGFRYMTDWAVTYEGWFIQSASASGTTLQLTPVYPSVDFQVTLVYAWITRRGTFYIPWDMWLNHKTETGSTLGFADKPNYMIMIVSPIMSGGYADYRFSATPICHGCIW